MEPQNENPRSGRGRGTAVSVRDNRKLTTTTPGGFQRRDRARALLTRLRVEYRPLVIGIRAAAHAAWPDVAHKTVNRALSMYCRCDNYLQAIAAGGPRYALDGAPSGEVSQEHRVAAVLVLSRRAEKAVKPPRVTRHEDPVASAAPKLSLPLLRLAKPRRRA